jgi:hypothetical protein
MDSGAGSQRPRSTISLDWCLSAIDHPTLDDSLFFNDTYYFCYSICDCESCYTHSSPWIAHLPSTYLPLLGSCVFFLVGRLELLEYSTGYTPAYAEENLVRRGKRVNASSSADSNRHGWYAGIYPESTAYSTGYGNDEFSYVGMYDWSLARVDCYCYGCRWSRDSSAGWSRRPNPALWPEPVSIMPLLVLEDRVPKNKLYVWYWEARILFDPKCSYVAKHVSMLAGCYRNSSESWWVASPCAGIK